MKDLPLGRTHDDDDENICRVLEENPQTSTRRLSEELGASKDAIHRHIDTWKIIQKL